MFSRAGDARACGKHVFAEIRCLFPTQWAPVRVRTRVEKCFDETFSTFSRGETVGLTKRQYNVIILLVAEGVGEVVFSEAAVASSTVV